MFDHSIDYYNVNERFEVDRKKWVSEPVSRVSLCLCLGPYSETILSKFSAVGGKG